MVYPCSSTASRRLLGQLSGFASEWGSPTNSWFPFGFPFVKQRKRGSLKRGTPLFLGLKYFHLLQNTFISPF